MSIIAIVGAGMMGSALSVPARDNGHTVRIVGTHLDRDIIDRLRVDGYHPNMKRTLPDGTSYYQIEDIEKAFDGADMLICGVSSFGVDWFAENIVPIIPENIPVLAVTKGLRAENGKLTSFPRIFKRHADKKISFNAIGGPCTSYELADRNQTQVAFCGDDVTILEKLKTIMETDYYHIAVTTDVEGLETAVALKNAYALAVSLAIGINEAEHGENAPERYNPQAGLFCRSMCEMTKLIEFSGGNADKLAFGAGDLYVTVFGGRTRRIGTLLGRGIPYCKAKEMLEGVTLESVAITGEVARAVRESNILDDNDFPLLLHIDDIINRNQKVCIPWDMFRY